MGIKRLQPYVASFRQTRPRAAGDIFPYIVMIVGSFVDGFEYHIIGQGMKQGDMVLDTYAHAELLAIDILNNVYMGS